MLFRKKKTDDKPVVKKAKEPRQKNDEFEFVKASREFEKSRIGEIEKSKAIAWRIAMVSSFLTACSIVAIVFLTPLKTVEPFVIRVDNNTGMTDIVTTLKDKDVQSNKEIARYFASQYVKKLEGYDWYTLQNNIDQVLTMSDSTMQNAIKTRFNKPDAPQNILKNQQRINIQINNVSFLNDNGLMQVRYSASTEPMNGGTYNVNSGEVEPKIIKKNYIATIGYEYVSVPTVDALRLVNPLGFTVKTYQVTEDGF